MTVWARYRGAVACRLGFLVLVLAAVQMGASFAEEGCPAGQFPSYIDDCANVAEYDRVRTEAEPMTFEARQESMHLLWANAEGVITRDTPNAFRMFLESYDAQIVDTIYFHSMGGSLVAALELGRLIRAAGYNTAIGRSISLEGMMNIYHYDDAACLSACAYAFLGGIERSYGGGDLYGVHRFGVKDGVLDGGTAQVLSGEIAAYVEEMGVDSRLLRLASSADFSSSILPVPADIAKELRIIYTPRQPVSFAVEDFRGSTVATTQFYHDGRFYSARLHCMDRVPTLVIWGDSWQFPQALLGIPSATVSFKSGERELVGTMTSGRLGDSAAYMAFFLPALSAHHLSDPGISLEMIFNSNLPPPTERVDVESPAQMDSFLSRVRWADAVTAMAFTLSISNAQKTVPLVFRECSDTGRAIKR